MLWFWYEAMSLIVQSELRDVNATVLPFAALLMGAIFFSLNALLVKKRMLAYAGAMVGSSMIAILVPFTRESALLVALAFLLLLYATNRIRRETRLSLGFSVAKSLRAGLPLYFTALSLMISLFYLTHLDTQRALDIFLPRKAFNYTLHILTKPNAPFNGLFEAYGEFSPQLTVNELLLRLVDKELSLRGLSTTRISQDELVRLIDAERAILASTYGIEARGEEKVGDIFYAAVTEKIENLFGPYHSYLPAASAMAFFLALKTLTLPLYFVTLLIVFVCVRLLMRAKFIVHEKQQIEIDRLALDDESIAGQTNTKDTQGIQSTSLAYTRVPRFTGWNKMKSPFPSNNSKQK